MQRDSATRSVVHADWCCILTVTSGRRTVSSIGPVPTRVVGTGPIPVVCARWCPTLPHPGGCSTIGAVRLSFRVRDGSGRFPVAVTTETTTWAVRQCVLMILLSSCLATHTVCGWWCGLGVDRIVDARAYRVTHPLRDSTCDWGCCCLCWPISTSQLTNRCRSSTSGLSTQ